jgi:hypothetical protein
MNGTAGRSSGANAATKKRVGQGEAWRAKDLERAKDLKSKRPGEQEHLESQKVEQQEI